MAIVVQTTIEPADRQVHDRLERSLEVEMMAQGGPPDGLMVHLAHPSGPGLLIVEVWRSESVLRSWWTAVMEPILAELDLTAGELEINPVWSFARP